MSKSPAEIRDELRRAADELRKSQTVRQPQRPPSQVRDELRNR